MFRHIRLISSAILFFALCLAASAQSRIDCSALNSRILKQAVRYCVYLPSGYDDAGKTKRYPVLYFLHGLGDNEQTLFNSGGWTLLDDLRKRHKMGDFLIAAPEGRRSFYINSADGKVRYSDFFLQEFMPYIESRYRIRRQRSARAISGVSMGGYGALRFGFAHPELFGSVSAQSAALITQSPQELNAGLNSGRQLGRLLGPVFGNPIRAQLWNQNSPFFLAKIHRAQLATQAIYFNCGNQDEFGFEIGAQALHDQMLAEGIRHDFHLYPGHHGTAYFLSHLDEVLEFHSHKFQAH